MPPKLFIQDGQIIFINRKHFLSQQSFSNWNLSHCSVSPRSVLEPNCPHGWSAMSGTLLSQSQIVPIYWGLTHYVAISRVQFFTATLRQIALTVHWNTSGPLCWALRRPEEHSWRKQADAAGDLKHTHLQLFPLLECFCLFSTTEHLHTTSQWQWQ